MSSGSQTILGVAFSAVTNGSNRSSSQRTLPSSIPSGKPTAIESPRPMRNSSALTVKCCWSSPLVRSPASATAI